jgi:hypothetical protein
MAEQGTSATGAATGTSAPAGAPAPAGAADAGTMTVGPSPLKILAATAFAAVAGTAGAAILVVFLGFLQTPWLLLHFQAIIVCTAAALVAFSAFAVFGSIRWVRPRVEIGPEGFVTYGMAGRRPRRWSDIEGDFAVLRVGWRKAVVYRLTDAFKASAPVAPLKPTHSLAGNDEAILFCEELALGARELAEVLNQWKRGVPSAASSN